MPTCDYITERDLELRTHFFRMREAYPYMNSRALWELVVRQRPSRHWLSYERVRRYVRERLRGDRCYAAGNAAGKDRRRQLDYIFRQVTAGDTSLPGIDQRIDCVMSRPAPEFFMSSRSAEKSVRATCRRLGLRI